MTELLETTRTPATALADYLAATSAGGSREMTSYLGATTPRQLDAPEVETRALLFGAAVHDLGWLRRYAVRGEDRFRWLSGMVTNAVEALPDATGAYNLVLNAQGRIQGDCCVWRESDALEIEATAEQSEALLAHFDRFIIMDDVEVIPLDGFSALGITGPDAGKILESLGIVAPAEEFSSASGMIAEVPVRIYRNFGTVVPHLAVWAAAEAIPALWRAIVAAGAKAVGAETLETLRIAEGIPAYGVDIQSRDLAQETSQMRALSFTKGCYLGQEIVERIRSRGQVHRHLRALEISLDDPQQLPAAGADVYIGSVVPEAKPAGALTSVTALQLEGERRILAIGMIRAEAEVGSQPLVLAGGTARILNSPPKFMRP